MSPGDLILTPAWTWHDHGSEGNNPVIWLDGLDIPILQFFEAGFCEDFEQEQYPVKPANHEERPRDTPMFAYPYVRTREALEKLAKTAALDLQHGYRMRYTNPTTGGHVLPTLASFLQLLPPGFAGRCFRGTDSAVYLCVEGSGQSVVGVERHAWGSGDIFVVPSWVPCRHEAGSRSILFSYSDRAAQESLGIWRESHVGAVD